MKAIYYPKLNRLSYWCLHGTTLKLDTRAGLTLPQAIEVLKTHIVQSEIVQALEIFKS